MTRRPGSVAHIVLLGLLLAATMTAAACIQVNSRDDSLEALTIAVKNNPDLELLATDEEAQIVTVRVKSADRVITVTPDDLEDGRLAIDLGEDRPSASEGSAAETARAAGEAGREAGRTAGEAARAAGETARSAGDRARRAAESAAAPVAESAGTAADEAARSAGDAARAAGEAARAAGENARDLAGDVAADVDEDTPPSAPDSQSLAERLDIADNKVRRTIDCEGREVRVIGNYNDLTLRGDCARLELIGNNNSVDAEGVDEIYVPGTANSVTWERGVERAEPKVLNPGSRNTIRQRD